MSSASQLRSLMMIKRRLHHTTLQLSGYTYVCVMLHHCHRGRRRLWHHHIPQRCMQCVVSSMTYAELSDTVWWTTDEFFSNQRLCIFGLYGAIQMLLLLFIIIKKVTNMKKASLSVSYDNERHYDLPPVGGCIPLIFPLDPPLIRPYTCMMRVYISHAVYV